jgi:predicted ATPase with chaperone activity
MQRWSSYHKGYIYSLCNRILFLDELPECRRSVLEVLCQPLEDAQVTIARAAMTLTFPARFMLAAAMNSYPCGWRTAVPTESRSSGASS